jgi:hypothetical protein
MNTIVVLEDPATKRRQECAPYAFASALEVPCLCGNLIHPIPGAWCTLCGRKVVDIWQESTPLPRQKVILEVDSVHNKVKAGDKSRGRVGADHTRK